MSEWWNNNLSSQFCLPSSTDFQYKSFIYFGLDKHNNIYNKQHYFSKPVLSDLAFNKLIELDVNKEKEDITKNIILLLII